MGLSVFKDNKINDDVLEPTLSEIREEGRKKELERKVIEVCEYIISTGDSYRKTAKIFGISAATVKDYCERFSKLKPIRYEKLKKVIDFNTESTIKDENVKKRVLENARSIVEGKTLEEISSDTGVEYWTVYRDITKRLEKVDKELFEQVSIILKSRTRANLNRGTKK